MTDIIRWDQIEAECGGFRAGFVATFRKYEGMPTDEKDAQGRTVKVTSGAFARHCGISFNTFKSWISDQHRAERALARAGSGPGVTRTGQMARQAVKSEKVAVEDKVGMLNDLMSDPKVVKQWREQRTPVVTEADAKAARAVARAVVEPILQASVKAQVPLFVDQLKAMAADLAEWDYEADDIRTLGREVRKVLAEVEVQEFRLGLIDASDARSAR